LTIEKNWWGAIVRRSHTTKKRGERSNRKKRAGGNPGRKRRGGEGESRLNSFLCPEIQRKN